MSASLANQKAIRAILTADDAVTALVPASSIVDSNAGLDSFPTIRIGEDQELPADSVGRYTTLHSTLHAWTREPGLAQAKAIAGAVRNALNLPHQVSWSRDGYRCLDSRIEATQFLRDPDGVTGHAVIKFVSTIGQVA